MEKRDIFRKSNSGNDIPNQMQKLASSTFHKKKESYIEAAYKHLLNNSIRWRFRNRFHSAPLTNVALKSSDSKTIFNLTLVWALNLIRFLKW